MITTIVLDIGNVLADFRWEKCIRELGFNDETALKIGKATVESTYWKEFDRGILKDNEIIDSFCELDPSIEKEIRYFFQHIEELVIEYDYSVDFVKELKRNGYLVYLLSNYGETFFKCHSKEFQFIKYTDGQIISYQVKHIKPESEIYEDLISQYHINPEETVFLDDLQVNLDGAKSFGFHTILFKNYIQAVEDLRKLGVRI